MIADTDVGGYVYVSLLALESAIADVREISRTRLSKMMVAKGEDIGAFIQPTSIVFYERATDPKKDEPQFCIKITSHWCPDPALGVEFHGGPKDGLIEPIGRGPDQLPHWHIVLPMDLGPMDFSQLELGNDLPSPSLQTVTYERAGKNFATDRWVYYVK